MKKSNFFAGILFLAAMAMFRLAFAQTGLQYAIVTDNSGALVGQVNSVSNQLQPGDPGYDDANPKLVVVVMTYTTGAAPLPPALMSALAPATTDTPKPVNVTVPASAPVAFCSSGNSYNKTTGLCADGKFPYKIVPLNSLNDPAAQNPTIVCRAPTVPTWNPAMKKWNCIVPTGFKNTLGEE